LQNKKEENNNKNSFHSLAAGDSALSLLAGTSMELKNVPHPLAERTTSRGSNSALHAMAEQPLYLAAVRVLTVWGSAL
jgi:hypothetical protein